MSFLRPTASSLRRASHAAPEGRRPHSETATAPTMAHRHASSSELHGAIAGNYSHVQSRVDTGLHSRVQRSLSRPPVAANSPRSAARAFSEKCDGVIQRAEEMLERTRAQEVRVTKDLEERRSHSPGHSLTPPQPLDCTPQRTPFARRGAFLVSPSSSMRLFAPHTTPVSPPLKDAKYLLRVSAGSTAKEATNFSAVSSFSMPPLPAPPPTPQDDMQSPPPSQPLYDSDDGDAVAAAAAAARDNSSSPSFLQRLRHSLQRVPVWSSESRTTSPAPAAPGADGRFLANRPSPRKSVHFVSPDKLETVTPTKVVEFPSSDSDDEAEEEEEEWRDMPPMKKSRTESVAATDTLEGESFLLPPAPPPSAVKAFSRNQGSQRSQSHTPSSSSSSTAHRTAPPLRSAGQHYDSPTSRETTSTQKGSVASRSLSSSSSRGSYGRPSLPHDVVEVYVQTHSISCCLSHLSRRSMENYLREEGASLPKQEHYQNKHLLATIRAQLKTKTLPRRSV